MVSKNSRSREVYDACRRYKHFYNKHKDVMSWSHKYHDLDLNDAIYKSERQLENAEDLLLKNLFKSYEVLCVEAHSETEVAEPCYMRWQGTPASPRTVRHRTTLELADSMRFIRNLTEYMSDGWRGR